MEYWGVDDLYLEPCCVQRYYQQRELLNWDHQGGNSVDIFLPQNLAQNPAKSCLDFRDLSKLRMP